MADLITAIAASMWNVPNPLTQLIGREQDVATVCTLLQQPHVGLLTLVGPGGVGKTRLSLQVASRLRTLFTDGVCFVSLASIHQPDLVLPTIATELGIQESGTLPLFEQVQVALQNKHLLLVLDNFEQVVAAGAVVESLLVTCSRLKIMVTSRAVLHMQAEQEFPVPPLHIPDLRQPLDLELLTQNAAVALFLQRACTVLPTFQLTPDNAADIARICVRLDGLPLALELAAARVKLLPPAALLARLSLHLLSGSGQGRPERQQTLRRTLEWSYNLLEHEEKRLFRLLSVFPDSCTLEAIEAVEALRSAENETGESFILDGVASLLDKSILQPLPWTGDEARFRLLETVREYGRECLRENNEAESIQQAHAIYFLKFVEEADTYLRGPEQHVWLARLVREQENVRAALEWLLAHETQLALRCCGAMWWFRHLNGSWYEGRRWLQAALERGRKEPPSAALARALCAAGDLAYYQDDYTAAAPLLEESIIISRSLGLHRELASALGALGVLMHMQGKREAAYHLLQESEALCRSLSDTWELAYLLRKLASLASRRGDLTSAAAYVQEGLTLAQRLEDRSLIATTLCSFGTITALQGDLAQAVVYVQEGLALARKLGDKGLIALAVQNLGYYAALQGDLAQAEAYAQEGLSLARELGDRMSLILALHSLGYRSTVKGDLTQAAAYFQEGFSLAEEIGDETLVGLHLVGMGELAVAEGRPERAARLFGAAETRFDSKLKMNTIERADYERAIERVRLLLGEEGFKGAWAEGRSMTPQQALTAPSTQVPLEKSRAMSPSTPLEKGRTTFPGGLTAREVDILRLVAQGLTDIQVAEKLVISPRTVNWHLTAIYSKLQITSRSAATRFAIEHHLN